jgi:homoserine kinase
MIKLLAAQKRLLGAAWSGAGRTIFPMIHDLDAAHARGAPFSVVIV